MQKRVLVLLLGAALAASPVFAKEGGDQYPNGAENWFAGAMPPPGNYFRAPRITRGFQ